MLDGLIKNRGMIGSSILVGWLIAAMFGNKDWLFDQEGKPACHKQVDLVIRFWQDEHKTRAFPNADGDGAESLNEVKELANYPELKSHYSYVPGLTRDDPGDLVLFYINKPTRWTWHGPVPTIFKSKQWILVPIDMKFYGGREDAGPGEFSERVSFDEFRKRLRKTLDYLKAKERPNWERIVKQHSEFLERTERELVSPK